MIFHPTPLPGLIRISAEPRGDERGAFARLYCPQEFAAAGLGGFVPQQLNLSRNPARHTLRGLHYQDAPYAEDKLVRVVRGRIFDVAVDLRPASPTYRRWQGFDLSEANLEALFIPKGFAHGFITLEPDTDILYQMGQIHVPGQARGLRYDEPAIGVDWPAAPAVVGEADLNWPRL